MQKNANVDVFLFFSFDESWKIHSEGWAGTSWGLWMQMKILNIN
jgi:exo-beta-1,3-glucanase (GH17 family)